MPDAGSRYPRPATVEDWDDDAQTTLSSSKVTANVAVKRSQTGLVSERPRTKLQDGSDSGYSSKATTVGSISTGGSKMAGLKIDTSLQERQRQPYLISTQGNAAHRESFNRPPHGGTGKSATREQPFVHAKGECMTCDQYGYHVDYTRSAAQPPAPTSSKATKKSSGTAKKNPDDSDPRLKRHSSTRAARPVNVASAPAVQPVYSTAPYTQTSGWSTPVTPMVYTYATPMTSTYVGYPGQASYFEPPPSPEARPANPPRRSSIYGEPVIQQSLREDQTATTDKVSLQKGNRPVQSTRRTVDYETATSARDNERRPTASIRRDTDSRPAPSLGRDYESRTTTSIGRDYDSQPAPSMERDFYRRTAPASEQKSDPRPVMSSHRSTRSIDQDRLAMPPPERPKKQAEVSRRPSIKKAATYNTEIVDHRRSRNADDYNGMDLKVPPSPKARDLPPSSYRGPPAQEQLPIRPQPPRKSVSYSDPVTIQSPSSTKNDSIHRRTTNPITSMEQKTAEAEAYQRERSNLTSEELTLEKLSDLKKQRSRTQSSETGSAFSHRESHHSSSKGSSARERSHTSGHRTSIILDGGARIEIPSDYVERKGRPLSINLGDVTISMGPKDKKKEQMLLEKAPSLASHASKRSVASATYEEPSRGRDHDESSRSSRRPSHNDDRRPPVTDRSHKSSRQDSRAQSSTRASRRQSVDSAGW